MWMYCENRECLDPCAPVTDLPNGGKTIHTVEKVMEVEIHDRKKIKTPFIRLRCSRCRHISASHYVKEFREYVSKVKETFGDQTKRKSFFQKERSKALLQKH